MESVLDGKAMSGKVLFQRLAESRRATKPDARLAPSWYGFANPFAGQASIAGIDQNMQTDIG